MISAQAINRLAGSNVAERLGSVLIVAGVVMLAWWLIMETDARSMYWAGDVGDSLSRGLGCLTERCSFESTATAIRLLFVGAALRFAVMPISRWLRSGSTRK